MPVHLLQKSLIPDTLLFRSGHASSPWLVICEHGSNHIPDHYSRLDLPERVTRSPLAWDPGALSIANALNRTLHGALVAQGISRLVVDCSLSPHAPDVVPTRRGRISIPGNTNLSEERRQERIRLYHSPFHQALDRVISSRTLRAKPSFLLSIRTFPPQVHGRSQPWALRIIDGGGPLASELSDYFAADPSLNIAGGQPADMEPFGLYALERQGRIRVIPAAIIAFNQELVAHADEQEVWAMRVAIGLRRFTERVRRSSAT